MISRPPLSPDRNPFHEMLELTPFSDTPPTSVEEALEQTRHLFARVGITDAEVSVTQPAAPGEGLKEACLEAFVPLSCLEAALNEAATTLAAAQGVKVSRTHIRFENGNGNPLSLTVHVEVDVRVFGATVTMCVDGEADATSGEHLHLRSLKLDAGSGVFAGIATSLIRPRLAEVEGRRIDLTKLAGVPVRLLRLERLNETPGGLRIGLRFV